MKNVLIVGLGRSGFAAARLLAAEAKVSCWDSKAEESFDSKEIKALKELGVEFGFGEEPDVSLYDMLVLSPGVPTDIPMVNAARDMGKEISGELEQAYIHCPGKFLAITGTNGKTTVTTLVGEIAKASGKKTKVVGNIGTPAAEEVYDADEETYMVTEVSSFQMETVKEFHPAVAALLNLTPDHLNRHHSYENYIAAKMRIAENQTESDVFIYNIQDELCVREAEKLKSRTIPFAADMILEEGIFVENGILTIADQGRKISLCKAEELQIPGHHNLENALAAAGIAYYGGIDPEVITAVLKSFKGVAHRIEFIKEVRGVRYVNDSKGTNPDASEKAIEATRPGILLIAGGYEKNSDFVPFINEFNGKVTELLLLGQTAERFREAALSCGFPEDHIHMCENLKECVQKGSLLAKAGDTVLLSPASASWGMYNNFEERGEDFRNIVNQLV